MMGSKRSPKTIIRKFTPTALCALLAFSALKTDACFGLVVDSNWQGAASGNWNVVGNWSAGVPGIAGTDDIARFLGSGGTPANLNVPISLNQIEFGSTTSWTISTATAQIITPTQSTLLANPIFSTLQGSHTISCGIAIPATTELDINNSPNTTLTLSGNITGATGTLAHLGDGTLILSGTNSHNKTVIKNGAVSISADNNLGAGAGILQFATSSGTLRITGTIPINARPVTLDAPATFLIDSPNTANFPGFFSGTSSLTKDGTGTLTLSTAGINSYQGGTTITGGGTLSVANNGQLGDLAGAISFGSTGGTLDITGTPFSTSRTFNLNNSVGFPAVVKANNGAAGTVALAGVIFGNTLTVEGPGTVQLQAPNTYNGGTIIHNGGQLSVSSDNNLGLPMGDLTFSGSPGTLIITSSFATSREIHLNVDGSFNVGSSFTLELSGPIDGAGGINMNPATSSGVLLLSNSTNSYTGLTTITKGFVITEASNVIPSTSTVYFPTVDGVLLLNGFSQTVENITGGGAGIHLGSNPLTTLTIVGSTTPAAYTGDISEAGSVVMGGTGTLTLSGGNAYIGSTQIASGTISISEDIHLGNVANSLIFRGSGGVLQVTGAFSPTSNREVEIDAPATIDIPIAGNIVTLNGILSGVSSLTQTGAGTLVLNGVNTYQGGTYIGSATAAGGIVQVSSDANLGAISGPVVFGPLGGELDISTTMSSARTIVLQGAGPEIFGVAPSQTLTLSGNISGTNGLAKIGLGTLILSGNNDYDGITTITQGVLQGTTSSVPGNVLNNSPAVAGFILDQDFNGGFEGAITGTGSFSKRGTGTVSMVGGSSIFTGSTTVEEGILLVNNPLTTSTLTVSPGALLGGVGPITNTSGTGINIHGELSPGNSIGTIVFHGGPVTQFTGSTVTIEVDPAASDQIVVDGNPGTMVIQPGVNLNVVFDAGVYTLPSTYLIVDTTGGTPGGVSGTFTTLTSNSPVFQFSLDYSNSQQISLILNSALFSNAVTHGNAGAVAFCADMSTAPVGSDFANILASLQTQTEQQLYYAFNQMQPSAWKGLIVSQQNIMLEVESALNARFVQYRPTACDLDYKERRAVWMEVFGSSQTQNERDIGSHSSQPSYTTRTFGVLLGMDAPVGDGFSVGGLTGYTRGHLAFQEDVGHGHVETAYLGPYARFGNDLLYVDASILGQANWYKEDRFIHFNTTDRTAHNSHDGLGALFHVGTGFWVKYCKLDVSPFFNFDYITMHEDGYHESGAQSLDLYVRSSSYQFHQFEGGFLLRTCAKIHHGLLIPEIRLSGISEHRSTGEHYRASLPDTNGCSFVVDGYYPNRALFAPMAKLTALLWNERLNAAVYFQGKYGDHFSQGEFGVNVAWNF